MHRWTALIQRRFEAGRTDVRDRVRGLPDWVERVFSESLPRIWIAGWTTGSREETRQNKKLEPVRFDSIKTE
jgi:hypothetical protein